MIKKDKKERKSEQHRERERSRNSLIDFAGRER
jgi:hypothetical protein